MYMAVNIVANHSQVVIILVPHESLLFNML